MNFKDMTKDEKSYYEQIRVRDDDLDKVLLILSIMAIVTFVAVMVIIFE